MRIHDRDRWVFGLSCALFCAACARTHGMPNEASSAAADGGASGAPGRVATDSTPSHVGAKAMADLEPVADAVADASAAVNGSATFAETADGVDFVLQMRSGCEPGNMYPTFIQAGTDCSDAALHGAHWDSPRGEGVGLTSCIITSGVGRTYYTRAKSDKKPWTIGSPAASNILGHALIISDPTTLEPLACGVITRAPDAASTKPNVSTQQRALLAGLCEYKMFVRDNAQDCPNETELAKCGTEHCELDGCVQPCAPYLACLTAMSDPCSSDTSCELSTDCASCEGDVNSCMYGFCSDQIACASPIAPDGPCSQLEACCAMQGDGAAQCLDTVRLLEKFSGDPSCMGLKQDWDATAHLAVPCHFQ
ncbi:MAG TPA: hypothetical protein VGI70_20555 [Polyangiales bacterium]